MFFFRQNINEAEGRSSVTRSNCKQPLALRAKLAPAVFSVGRRPVVCCQFGFDTLTSLAAEFPAGLDGHFQTLVVAPSSGRLQSSLRPKTTAGVHRHPLFRVLSWLDPKAGPQESALLNLSGSAALWSGVSCLGLLQRKCVGAAHVAIFAKAGSTLACILRQPLANRLPGHARRCCFCSNGRLACAHSLKQMY